MIDASVRGWVNHVRHGNTTGLRKAVLDRGRARIKALDGGGAGNSVPAQG